MDFSSVLTLVQAVARDLEIEPFPELGAVMLRGPYSQVNAAKAALDGYLRSSSSYGQTDALGFRLVRLAYADASEASMSLQGQFQSVRIVPVRGENAVVIGGPARHADQAAAAIRELDRAPALLSFDAQILEVNSDDMDSFGVNWQNGQGQPMLTLTLKEIDPPIIPGTPPSSDVFSARPWIRTSLQIVSQIKLLEGAGKAKVLARPSRTTLENRTAKMVTGDRYTIVINQTSGRSSWQQLQYIDSGVHLELTARLASDVGIVVTLNPRISAVAGFSREGYPVMSTREAQTTVRLRAKTRSIGVLLSPLYDVPAAVLDRAVSFGMDADAVVDTMFLVELASEDNAAKTANFEEAASNAKQVIPELLPLRQRWPVREFPKELLPLMPPPDFQGTTAGRLQTAAPSSFRSVPKDMSAAGAGSSSSIVDPSVLYGTERVSPFKAYVEVFAERVDPSSGALIIRQTDFVLPGRAGLDFSLTRVYNGGLASLDLPRVKAEGVERRDGSIKWAVWGEKIPNTFYEKRFGLG